MNNLNKERPDGWAESSLASFFETLFSNTIASYDNLSEERERLEIVSKIFDDLVTDLKDPEHYLPTLLIIRAIGAYRLASLLSMTAPIDAHTVMRSCLEYAGYAHLMKLRPEHCELWLTREDSEMSRNKVSGTFSAANIKKALKDVDSEIGKTYQTLYQHTISNGAHPNELALTTALHIVEEPGQTRLEVQILPAGGPTMREAMGTCAQIGLTVLKICSLILPKLFEERRLNEAIKEAARKL